MAAPFSLRRAVTRDADDIAAVFSSSYRLLTFLPMLHTPDEDRRFIGNTILTQCEVTIAETPAGEIASFLTREGEDIRLLYTHPRHIGKGGGGLLIEAAKGSVETLELWCFQANVAARRFYERHGFTAIRFTDGADNEEEAADVRYRWQRQSYVGPISIISESESSRGGSA
jgi:GNAT superfamily N-acetyltransferase